MSFTLKKRQQIEVYLKEGYMLKDISKMCDISLSTLLNEIKKGLTPDEYKSKRYVKYNHIRAIASLITIRIGTEQLEALLEIGVDNIKEILNESK